MCERVSVCERVWASLCGARARVYLRRAYNSIEKLAVHIQSIYAYTKQCIYNIICNHHITLKSRRQTIAAQLKVSTRDWRRVCTVDGRNYYGSVFYFHYADTLNRSYVFLLTLVKIYIHIFNLVKGQEKNKRVFLSDDNVCRETYM